MTKSTKTMMQGAVILSIAALIAKILSAVYRVPFQNLVGNTGFYVYQQVYPIYGIGMTFALSGFPVFLSNMVAQYQTEYALGKLLRRSFVLMAILGMICFAGLWTQAALIAQLMGDIQLEPVVKSVSWMFLTMPFLVVARGYFQGTMRMVPTAISQVMEQVVRVGVIIAVASLYTQWTNDLYVMGSWTMSSATIAAIAAIMVLGYYLRREHFQQWSGEREIPATHLKWGHFIRRFLVEGGTLCLLSSILVLYQLVDSFSLFKGLVEQGIASEMAKELKGIFDRGQPLVQLGMVVGVGFSSSYMPLLTRAFARKQTQEFNALKHSLLKMTIAFASAATAGMIVILPRMNHMLFGDTQGNLFLALYVVSILLASLIMAYHGILQSMGKYYITLIGLLAGLVVKWVGNFYLVAMFQTLGASLATVLGLAVMFGVIYVLAPHSAAAFEENKSDFIRRLGFVVIGMILVVGVSQEFINLWLPVGVSRTADTLIAFVLVAIGAIAFVALALQLRLLTVREWIMIPKGKSVLRFTKRWNKEK